jgi:hypothetical protein
MELLIVVLAIVVVDVLAARVGVDSRPGFEHTVRGLRRSG